MARYNPDRMDDNSHKYKAMRARVKTLTNFINLGIQDDGYKLLSLFLRGKDKNFKIMKDMTSEDIKKLELLSGPHAIAILKIGLLRQGVSLKIRAKQGV